MEPQKQEELTTIILNDFPTPIAVLYYKLLQEERWELKTRSALELFEVWMRSVTLQMLIHYLAQDIKSLHNDEANRLNTKIEKIYKPSLGDVVDLFFSLLKAYGGHPDLLFMTELYNIQWQPGTNRSVSRAREDFDTIVKIRNELAHGRNKPQSEHDWQGLYEDVEPLLLSVLSRFLFVRYYRIVYGLEAQSGKGTFIELCGLEPPRIELYISETESVQGGRFYLHDRRAQGRFYELHPLFLPWPSDFLDWGSRKMVTDKDRKHAAIYDSYIKNKIYFAVYTEYVKDLVLKDPKTIARFRELFEETLKHIQLARTVTKRLHWREFQRIASQITQLETEAIRQKFSKDLYLQRQHIKSAFEHFLRSDKVAFVLLGQSGVGKSNFVLSMYENYRESQDIHLIVFDSARLSSEQKLVHSLTEMFASRIALVDRTNKERKIEDILEEIDNIEGIEKKEVILAFDAINENSKPHELLKRIDDLVSYNKYPWLKIMITSRPEAWQNMKRQYRLTESKYYRQPDTEELEVELRGFDQQTTNTEGWLAIGRFETVELPQVYELYQERYRLKSSFEVLSPEMKVMLRDPLALRLVAETYGSLAPKPEKAGLLPESVRASKLYEQYINNLIDDSRLERADVEVFLKQKLLPLMFRPGDYRNKLDAEILTTTIDKTSGKPLSEEIELTDIVPSTGKPVNHSFQNLVDAGLLIKQGSYSDYEISFKYERFYDFFGGKYLFGTVLGTKAKIEWYQVCISQLEKRPFLWGSIQQALLMELEAYQQDLFIELCLGRNTSLMQTERNLYIDVMTKYGAISIKEARILIKRLMSKHHNSGIPLILIEVAYNLEEYYVIEKMAAHKLSTVRETNARFIHYTWRRSPKHAFAILTKSAYRFRKQFIPNLRLLHTCILSSITIINEGYSDPITVEHIRKVWVNILNKILFLKLDRIPFFGRVIMLCRGLIFDFLSYTLWKSILAPLLTNADFYDYDAKDYELFFERASQDKQRIVKLIRTINSDVSELQNAKDDFIFALTSNDVIPFLLVYLILGAHGIRYDEPITSPKTNPIIPFVKELLEYFLEDSRGQFSVPFLLMILSGMGRSYRADSVDDAFLRIFEDNLLKHYRINNCSSSNNRGHGSHDTGFGFYIQVYSLKDENINSRFLSEILMDAIQNRNVSFLTRFLREIKNVSANRKAIPFLNTIRLVLDHMNGTLDAELRSVLENNLIKTLSTIQISYPRDVMKFVENLGNSFSAERIRQNVLVRTEREELGGILTGRFSWFVRDAILENNNQFLLERLIWWVEKAAEVNNITSWFGLLAKMMVNIIYLPDNVLVFKSSALVSDMENAQ